MKKIGILLLSLALTALVACAWGPERAEPEPETRQEQAAEPEETPAAGEGIVVEPVESSHAFTDSENRVFGQVTLHGLAFSNGAAAEAIQNDLLREEEDYLAALADEEGALFAADSGMTFTHEITYSLAYQDRQLLSVLRDSYGYQDRAAHAQTERRGYTYDVATGRRLSIADLLGADWRETAVSAVYQRLNEAGELENYYPDLEKLLVSQFRDDQWYADGDTVYLIYNPYQIAPYAAGILEFPLTRPLLSE